jgi:putative iron-regulated protein
MPALQGKIRMTTYKKRLGAVLLSLAFAGAGSFGAQAAAPAVQPKQVVTMYADIASANYQDALAGARTLRTAINALAAKPSAAALKAARDAWIAARVPYQQTEAFRFGNPIVDDWEGRVNAWPLDEGLIDYVDASYGTTSDENAFYALNVIANPTLTVAGKQIDAAKIVPALLSEQLQEAGGNEANVATGYHAIEFLLWGQDLNGTGAAPADRKGTPQERHAGNRPFTDFDPKQCTGGHCDRRVQFLKAAADLLVTDLEEMVGNWKPNGAARKAVVNDPAAGLSALMSGLGSLSYGELAGERMKLGLILHDPEEEHDCFSDNTHNSHYYDQVGIRNVYLGTYTRTDGKAVKGASVSDLVRAQDAALDDEVRRKLQATTDAMTALKRRAETVETYDRMIAEGNAEGNAVVQAAIDRLVDQTRSFERVVAVLKLGAVKVEGSDSLDKPGDVFK